MASSKYYREFDLDKFVIPEIKIRKEQTDHEAFHNTKRSIALRGVQQAVLGTLKIDGKPHPDGKTYLVDGLQRVGISGPKHLDLGTIPAIIHEDMSQEELLLLQDSLNCHRIPQKPKERLQHLKRLMVMHPEWDINDLANRVCEKATKIKSLMKLDKLTPEALELADRGTIKLTAAVFLAGIPLENQNEYLQDAATMPADKWISHSQSVKDSLRRAKISGNEVLGTIITPHPKKRVELIAMWQDAQNKYELNGNDYNKGYVEALAVTLQVDAATIKAKEDEKNRLKEERTKKNAEKKIDDAQSEIDMVIARKKELQNA